jgi:hypothetical protein
VLLAGVQLTREISKTRFTVLVVTSISILNMNTEGIALNFGLTFKTYMIALFTGTKLALATMGGVGSKPSYRITEKWHTMIRPIQSDDLEYERGVKDAACELAETHVLDVLAVVESAINRLRFNLNPEHDGKVGNAEAVRQGMGMTCMVLEALDEVVQVNCMKLVNEADEDDQLLGRDEYVASEVGEHLVRFLKGIADGKKHLDRA